MLLLGGSLAISISITLFIGVVIRPGASINALSGFTLGLGIMGGMLVLIFSGRVLALVTANLILVLGAAPTVFGPVWLLYVPPIILVAVGTVWKVLERYFERRRLTKSLG